MFEIVVLQSNVRDDFMSFAAEMWNLCFVIGLGNFGGLYLGTTISTK
jgi:hypothetical protein